MTELSPAAQAVFDAYLNAPCGKPRQTWVAAALRAAADHVIPMTKSPWGSTLVPVISAEESRKRLLTIADELEAND